MEYCYRCLKMVRVDAGCCPQCGRTIVIAVSPTVLKIGSAAAVGEEDQQKAEMAPVEVWLVQGLRWVRGLVLVGVAVTIMAAIVGTLVEQSRAAQASWFVQAQLGQRHHERREQLKQALAALETLYEALIRTTEGDGPMMDGQRRRWKEELRRVRQRYLLDGQATFGRDNPRAEGALRNATLYLSSLEGSGAVGQRGHAAELERAIRRSFLEARADLAR